jgi:tRNA (guanine-N7-)-methyltransferase
LIQPIRIATAAGEMGLAGLDSLDRLVPGKGAWEVEIGFGKGRYLLRRCQESPGLRFLGIELATEYWHQFVERARKRGLTNWAALRGEALYLISAALPASFAAVVHVYFPDPWPKTRHRKRRLFDPETLDLVLGLLQPGGRLLFATDFLEYGEHVREILDGYPGIRIERREGVWEDGPRTNYEAKYIAEGRPILRLEIARELAEAPLHPEGAPGVLAATFYEDD